MNYAAPRIEEIATIEFRPEQKPWPFATDCATEIDAHWAELVRRNPHHYNGRVLLMRDVDVVATGRVRRLKGGCFVAEYKAFLAWRDFGFPDRTVCNAFAMAALLSADGAFLLGEMGKATANAGQIYFPAGTPEPDDLVGESVDLERSVRRELREETGIWADEIAFDEGWTVVFQDRRLACMKTVRSARSAAELVARGAAFIASEKQPELARLIAVRSIADLDERRMPDFIQAYLRYALPS
jgi:8-oxo-dGTP pyrophosphatase MutT (NUDIX family)